MEKNLGAPGFRIVDASFYLPAQKRNAAEEYAAGHIPGAVFFDQDVIADRSTGLPHTIPPAELFAEAAGKFGISETDTIVVYDGPGFFAAPRAWWLFRLFGAGNVYVLDGGLDGWKRDGRPVASEPSEPVPARFDARFDASRVTTLDAMKSLVAEGAVQIADARGPGRFQGTEPEPRAGVRSGHMPGARNVPGAILSENGRFNVVLAAGTYKLFAADPQGRYAVSFYNGARTFAAATSLTIRSDVPPPAITFVLAPAPRRRAVGR